MSTENLTHVYHAIDIRRSPEEVFQFVTDFSNDKHWWKAVIDSQKMTEGEMRVGTKFIQHSKVLFVTIESHMQVLEWNPPHSIKCRNESPQLPYDLLYTFEPIEDGTRFSLDASVQMKGALKLIKPITIWIVRRQLKKYFGLLKQVMEQSD